MPAQRTKVSSVSHPRAPSALAFRYPAEWERHEATWVAWPHNRSDWPGKFAAIPWVFAEIVRKLAPGEKVRILVDSKQKEGEARRVLFRAGVNQDQIEMFRILSDRGWARDCGPMFVRKNDTSGEKAIIQFHFNAWARYRNWKLDNAVPAGVAKFLSCPLIRARLEGRDFVLEGGSIDVNGRGTLLTTEECLLDEITQVRNPGLARRKLEVALRLFFGVTNILWLGKGIAG